MWALFTAALTRSSSTTRTSIVNVSSNFFITAILGAMIFGEKLPLGWWAGAGLLAAGNVVIGRREEAGDAGRIRDLGETDHQAQEAEGLLAREEEDLMELRESLDGVGNATPVAKQSRSNAAEEVDNPI